METIYSRVSLKDLNEKYIGFLNWTVLLNNFLKEYNSTQKLTNDDQIVIMGLEYFKSLNTIINDYLSEPRKEKTLKLFLIFNLIKYALPLLSNEYRSQLTPLGEAITGKLRNNKIKETNLKVKFYLKRNQ